MEIKIQAIDTSIIVGSTRTSKYYGWHLAHACLTSGDQSMASDDYGDRKCKKGDIVELILDLQNWTISYKLNGKSLGVAFRYIEKCGYIVAINIYEKGNSLELVSYQCSEYKQMDEARSNTTNE